MSCQALELRASSSRLSWHTYLTAITFLATGYFVLAITGFVA